MQSLKLAIRNTTLQKKVTSIFTIMILLVSLIVSIGTVHSVNDIINQKNDTYFNEIALQTTNNIEYNIQSTSSIATSIATNSDLNKIFRAYTDSITASQQVAYISTVEQELYQSLWSDPDLQCISIFLFSSLDYTASRNAYESEIEICNVGEIEAAGGALVWWVEPDSEHAIFAAKLIYNLETMTPIGYLYMQYDASYFGDILYDISVSSATVDLINQDGIVISSNVEDNKGELVTDLDGVDYDLTGTCAVSNSSYATYLGQWMENGWKLVLKIPQQEFITEFWGYILPNFAWMSIILVVAIYSISYLINRLFEPIRQLCSNMSLVGQGNFTIRSYVNTKDEIGMLSDAYNEMIDNLESLVAENYDLEIAKRQAELEFLRMQINPHFLYNTLDTINWSARMHKADDVADMITALGELLRAVVKQEDIITIGQELHNVRNFTFIQQHRFGDKITFHFEIDPHIDQVLIPNFLIQPLIENAVIHGLEPKRTAGEVHVVIQCDDEFLHVSITDNGVGMAKADLLKMQQALADVTHRDFIGLKNVNKRLQYYYGDQSRLHIQSKQNEGFEATFSLPIAAYLDRPRLPKEKPWER